MSLLHLVSFLFFSTYSNEKTTLHGKVCMVYSDSGPSMLNYIANLVNLFDI